MKRIAIFCGSRSGKKDIYLKQARLLGQELVQRNIAIVYGGSSIGLMGAIADEMMDAGGEVIGVIPDSLFQKEVAHQNITQLYRVGTMHERKFKMYDLAEAFIIMPGGIGTLDEFFEVITWIAIGEHDKPCAIYNIDQYYTPLLSLLKHMADEQFVDQSILDKIIIDDNPSALVQSLIDKKKG